MTILKFWLAVSRNCIIMLDLLPVIFSPNSSSYSFDSNTNINRNNQEWDISRLQSCIKYKKVWLGII